MAEGCQGFALDDYGSTPGALTLKPSGFCNVVGFIMDPIYFIFLISWIHLVGTTSENLSWTGFMVFCSAAVCAGVSSYIFSFPLFLA